MEALKLMSRVTRRIYVIVAKSDLRTGRELYRLRLTLDQQLETNFDKHCILVTASSPRRNIKELENFLFPIHLHQILDSIF